MARSSRGVETPRYRVDVDKTGGFAARLKRQDAKELLIPVMWAVTPAYFTLRSFYYDTCWLSATLGTAGQLSGTSCTHSSISILAIVNEYRIEGVSVES